MPSRTALIVGAGIGGLAAAVALKRAGWRVRIFERAASPRELGFALNLAPNALLALREIGLADRVIANGYTTAEVEVRRAGGQVLKRMNVSRALSNAPQVVVLRPAVHGALLEAVDPSDLVLSSEATGFVADGARVAVTLKDGHRETGDLLIGADGIGSAIRRALHPNESPLRRSGYYAIRGVAYGAAHELGDLSAIAYLGHGVESAAARAGQDAVYWYMSLLAEDVPAKQPDAPSLAAHFADALGGPVRAIVKVTTPDDVRLDELFDREPIGNWGTGPVTLLGDAAHPMLPHTGQGAAQALEDAIALGFVLTPDGDIDRSLRRYEQRRSARTNAMVKRGRRIAAFTTSKSGMVAWLRATSIRLMPVGAAVSAFMAAGRTDPFRDFRSPPAPDAPAGVS